MSNVFESGQKPRRQAERPAGISRGSALTVSRAARLPPSRGLLMLTARYACGGFGLPGGILGRLAGRGARVRRPSVVILGSRGVHGLERLPFAAPVGLPVCQGALRLHTRRSLDAPVGERRQLGLRPWLTASRGLGGLCFCLSLAGRPVLCSSSRQRLLFSANFAFTRHHFALVVVWGLVSAYAPGGFPGQFLPVRGQFCSHKTDSLTR